MRPRPERRTAGPSGSARPNGILSRTMASRILYEAPRVHAAPGESVVTSTCGHNCGGCSELWSNVSAEAEVFGVKMTYGAKADYKSAGREPSDYVNSRLIIMWGWSPGDGTFGTGTLQYLKLAKKHGARIVCVDPRVTRTSYELADEHVFIRPSTDAAALIAMAYVIASEGLHDQAFLDRHVLGFDEAHLPPGAPEGASYRSYVF